MLERRNRGEMSKKSDDQRKACWKWRTPHCLVLASNAVALVAIYMHCVRCPTKALDGVTQWRLQGPQAFAFTERRRARALR